MTLSANPPDCSGHIACIHPTSTFLPSGLPDPTPPLRPPGQGPPDSQRMQREVFGVSSRVFYYVPQCFSGLPILERKHIQLVCHHGTMTAAHNQAMSGGTTSTPPSGQRRLRLSCTQIVGRVLRPAFELEPTTAGTGLPYVSEIGPLPRLPAASPHIPTACPRKRTRHLFASDSVRGEARPRR